MGEKQPDPAPAAGWGAIVAEVPAGLEDELVAGVAATSLGASVEERAPGVKRIRVYVASRAVAQAALTDAAAWLRRCGLDPGECGLRAESVADGRWVERYQASLRPFPLGRRFTVVPTGQASADRGRVPILLVPGRAFGTGEHATTAMCVELLERHVRPDSRWIDVGCGSGILALVATHCGASRVVGIDDDPEAIAVATKVLRSNGVASGVELVVGSTDRYPQGRWDVVCNIGARFLARSWAGFARLLGPSGRAIASGFLVEELDPMRTAMSAAGLGEIETVNRGEWCAIVAGRRDDARGGAV